MSFINDNLKRATLNVAVPASGPIGTAAATVDIASSFNIAYTGAPNGVITLANPTDAQAGDIVKVANTGAVTFSFGGDTVNAGFHTYAEWSGTAWTYLDGGRNAGVSVPVAAVPAGALLVTHNLGMPVGTFSSVLFRAYNTLGNEIIFKRNKAGDTANVMAFTSPVALTTNLPITFDFSPLA
jgi:hypothetical protein